VVSGVIAADADMMVSHAQQAAAAAACQGLSGAHGRQWHHVQMKTMCFSCTAVTLSVGSNKMVELPTAHADSATQVEVSVHCSNAQHCQL
jgi:hypothetical protein